MFDKPHKTQIGIQGGVMGWDDPWHFRLCSSKMRTGEGKVFPSQDPTPTPDEFIGFIRELGVDFYLHHVMPDQDEIDSFVESMKKYDMNYFLANEYGNANGPYPDDSNRYDLPEQCVEKAKLDKNFMGLFYDETEHLQLHPNIYLRLHAQEFSRNNKRHQWTSVEGKSLQQIEDDIVATVRKRVDDYGGDVPLYSEQVFPIMYHTLARGGFNPCPKVLKEEFQSLQVSTALGAAKQYKRKMGICVDLWGQDVGNWFTRIWGFPAHSPVEYKSALEMAYLMGPEVMFTENIDPLAVYTGTGFEKTEFADIFEEFIKKFIPENPRYYHHGMVEPDIVVIRSDDCIITEEGCFFGGGPYGSLELKADYKMHSPFKVFNLLSRGTIPANGNTFFLPQYEYPSSQYVRTEETLKTLPLKKGVGKEKETCIHKLFYPIHNVAVFDERIDSETLGHPKLILLAGSRMTDACLKAVGEKVRNGAVCIAAKWLLPEGFISKRDGSGQWIVTEDFLDSNVRETVEPLLGEADCWMQRFGDYEVRFYNENGDGISLSHEVRKVSY